MATFEEVSELYELEETAKILREAKEARTTWGDVAQSIVPVAAYSTAKGIGGAVQAVEEMNPASVISSPAHGAAMLLSPSKYLKDEDIARTIADAANTTPYNPLRLLGNGVVANAIADSGTYASNLLSDLGNAIENGAPDWMKNLSIANAEKALGKGTTFGGDAYTAWNEKAKEAMPAVETGSAKAHVLGAASSIAQNVPGMVAAAITRRPMVALAPMGVVSGGQQYGGIRDERPDLSVGTALAGGLISGTTEVLSEKLPLDALINPKYGFGKRLLMSALADIPGEEVATIVQEGIVSKATTNPDMTWGEFVQSLKDTAIQSAIASPVQGSVMHGVVAWANRQQAKMGARTIGHGDTIDLTQPGQPKVSPTGEQASFETEDSARANAAGAAEAETASAEPNADYTNSGFAEEDLGDVFTGAAPSPEAVTAEPPNVGQTEAAINEARHQPVVPPSAPTLGEIPPVNTQGNTSIAPAIESPATGINTAQEAIPGQSIVPMETVPNVSEAPPPPVQAGEVFLRNANGEVLGPYKTPAEAQMYASHTETGKWSNDGAGVLRNQYDEVIGPKEVFAAMGFGVEQPGIIAKGQDIAQSMQVGQPANIDAAQSMVQPPPVVPASTVVAPTPTKGVAASPVQVAGATDLSSKSMSELVEDIINIANDAVAGLIKGEQGAVPVTGLPDTVYNKFKPYIIEIANRAKSKMLDARTYIIGAIDAMKDGPAKTLFEKAVDRYLDEMVADDDFNPDRPGEQRLDANLRRLYNNMSEEAKLRAIWRNPFTDLYNKRAYKEKTEHKAFTAVIDGDSLKAINDTFGHEIGDELIRLWGDALRQAGVEHLFHISGDEFVMEADSKEQLDDAMLKAYNYLEAHQLEVEYEGEAKHLIGGLTYGVGKNFKAADKVLYAEKERREASGERAGRGDLPAAITGRLQAGEGKGNNSQREILPAESEVISADQPSVGTVTGSPAVGATPANSIGNKSDFQSVALVYKYSNAPSPQRKTIHSLIKSKQQQGKSLSEGEALILDVEKSGEGFGAFKKYIAASGYSEQDLNEGLEEKQVTGEAAVTSGDYTIVQYEATVASRPDTTKKKWKVLDKNGKIIRTGLTRQKAEMALTALNDKTEDVEKRTDELVAPETKEQRRERINKDKHKTPDRYEAAAKIIAAGLEKKFLGWHKDGLTSGQIQLKLQGAGLKMTKETVTLALEFNGLDDNVHKTEAPKNAEAPDLKQLEDELILAMRNGWGKRINKLKTQFGLAYQAEKGESPTKELERISALGEAARQEQEALDKQKSEEDALKKQEALKGKNKAKETTAVEPKAGNTKESVDAGMRQRERSRMQLEDDIVAAAKNNDGARVNLLKKIYLIEVMSLYGIQNNKDVSATTYDAITYEDVLQYINDKLKESAPDFKNVPIENTEPVAEPSLEPHKSKGDVENWQKPAHKRYLVLNEVAWDQNIHNGKDTKAILLAAVKAQTMTRVEADRILDHIKTMRSLKRKKCYLRDLIMAAQIENVQAAHASRKNIPLGYEATSEIQRSLFQDEMDSLTEDQDYNEMIAEPKVVKKKRTKEEPADFSTLVGEASTEDVVEPTEEEVVDAVDEEASEDVAEATAEIVTESPEEENARKVKVLLDHFPRWRVVVDPSLESIYKLDWDKRQIVFRNESDSGNAWQLECAMHYIWHVKDGVLTVPKADEMISKGMDPLDRQAAAEIGVTLFSRGTSVFWKKITRVRIERIAERLFGNAVNRPKVVVVKTPADLPFAAPDDARGAYRNGKMYLVENQLADSEDVITVIFHEIVGHFGLRGFFGEALDRALLDIFENNPLVRKYAAEWKADNLDVKKMNKMSDADYYYRSIEEAMAKLAQERRPFGIAKKLLSTVQGFLRKIGMNRLANMLESKSNAEALKMLHQAGLYIRTGQTISSPAPAALYPSFMTSGWHGGRAFNSFSESNIGDSNGMAEGWGVYIADLKSVGEYFAGLSVRGKKFTQAEKETVLNKLKEAANESVTKDWMKVEWNDYNESIRNFEKNGNYSEIAGLANRLKIKDLGVAPFRNLYKVSIGKEGSTETWLDWDKRPSGEVVGKIVSGINGLPLSDDAKQKLRKLAMTAKGKDVYQGLAKNRDFLKSQGVDRVHGMKAVSKFLLSNGIDGNRYPAGTTGKSNYVVFDASNVSIDERASFSRKKSEPDFGKAMNEETNERTEKAAEKAKASFSESYKKETAEEAEERESQPDDVTVDIDEEDMAATIDRLYLNVKQEIFELPEIVELIHLLTGNVPRIRHFLGKQLSIFRKDTGIVDLIHSITPEQMTKVLGKNVGHILNWLPDHAFKRGTIFSKIAAIQNYFRETLAEYPGAPGQPLTPEDRARLRQEAADMAKRQPEKIITFITREVPQYKQTSVTPEMILQLMRGLTNQPKEVLDYLKSVDGPTKASIVKEAFKGLVSDPIAKLGATELIGYKTETEVVETPAEDLNKRIAKLFQQKLAEEIAARKLYTKEIIMDELRALSVTWNPFDPNKDDAFTAKRFSSNELYADAVSVLLNNPQMLEDIAPTFRKAFFSYIDARPNFRKVYDSLGDMMKDRESIVAHRRAYQEKMIEASTVYREMQHQMKMERERVTHKSLWRGFRKLVDTKTIRYEELTQQRIKELTDEIKSLSQQPKTPATKVALYGAESRLAYLLKEGRLDYWMKKVPYFQSEVYAFMKTAEGVIERSRAAGISDTVLSQFMMNQRMIHDRKDKANPQGMYDAGAEEINAQLLKEHPEIEKYSAEFRKVFRKHIVEPAVKAKFLPEHVERKMLENEYYVTYNFLKGVKYDPGDGWAEYRVAEQEILAANDHASPVMKQYGGLGEIDNVIHATLLKGEALLLAARHHEVKMLLLEDLADSASPESELRVAKRTKDGAYERPPKGWGMIVVTPHGHKQAYYIDEELAEVWNRDPVKASALIKFGLLTKKIITKLFIGWNPPWIAANTVRDAFSTWKKNPGSSKYLFKAYKNTFWDAWDAAMGRLPERELRMWREHALTAGRFMESGKVMLDMEKRNLLKKNPELFKAINRENAKNKDGYAKFYEGLQKFQDWWTEQEGNKYSVLPPLLHAIETLGLASERWGKFAGDEMFRLMEEDAKKEGRTDYKSGTERTEAIISRVASPNFYMSGTGTKVMEIIAPFSRMAIQDLSSGIDAYKENRKTYFLKTVIANILPRTLLYAAAAGMLGGGDDDYLKQVARKISSYYRKMYNCIPIALWGDEAIFFSIPQDYTGQSVSAVWDAILTGKVAGAAGVIGGVAVAQPFNLNPFIGVAADIAMYYAADRVPVDYYGNKIMNKREEVIGGTIAAKALGRMVWNEFFGGLIYKVGKDKIEKDSTQQFVKDVLKTTPASVLGKFIRISGAGEGEIIKANMSKVERQQALITEEIQGDVYKMLNSTPREDHLEKLADIYLKYVEEGKINPQSQPFKSFSNNYMKIGSRKEGSIYLDEVTRANTNATRADAIKSIQDMLPQEREEEFNEELEENRMMTRGVMRELNRLRALEEEDD